METPRIELRTFGLEPNILALNYTSAELNGDFQFQRQVKKIELSLENDNNAKLKRFATSKKNLVRLPTTITTGVFSCHNFLNMLLI